MYTAIAGMLNIDYPGRDVRGERPPAPTWPVRRREETENVARTIRPMVLWFITPVPLSGLQSCAVGAVVPGGGDVRRLTRIDDVKRLTARSW